MVYMRASQVQAIRDTTRRLTTAVHTGIIGTVMLIDQKVITLSA